MDGLIVLAYLAAVLLIGIFCTFIARKLKIPDVLLLLTTGIILGNVTYGGKPLVSFDLTFLNAISILALVMIILDSSSRFKLKKFELLSTTAIKISFVFLLLNMIFLSLSVKYALGIDNLLLVLMFSALMSGTDPATVLSMLKQSTSKVVSLLRIESLINTPLMVIIPFLILDIVKNIQSDGLLPDFFMQFLQQIIVGIGSGILVAIIMLKFIKKSYSHVLSPLVLITSALIAYILAELLEGNGVLSVTSMGLLFGNVYVRQKIQLQEFSSIFSKSLEILVFILIGFVIKISFSVEFIIQSLALFLVYIIIRYLAVAISVGKAVVPFREKIFMALNAQKGIAVAVVTFTLSISGIKGMDTILDLVLAFMFYSIIISTIAIRFSDYFVKAPELELSEQKRKEAEKKQRQIEREKEKEKSQRKNKNVLKKVKAKK